MKSLLILVLSLALVAAAFMTRPAKREFVLYLLDQQAGEDREWTRKAIERADRMARDVTVKDRLLWTDVEKDGKVVYTGAFAHFFPRNRSEDDKSMPEPAQLARILGQWTTNKGG